MPRRPRPLSAANPVLRDADGHLKPPLKWAGGKRWLLPHLEPLWAPHRARRLVEPFCGGLAVVLGLRPHRALLGDANPHAVSFYHWLQRGLVADVPMENDEALYYAHRERFNALILGGQADSREAAEMFYYLNRTGYNGLCRFNRKGAFNVPFGRYARLHYVRDFTPYRRWRTTTSSTRTRPTTCSSSTTRRTASPGTTRSDSPTGSPATPGR